MAELQKCRACGKDVARSAKACPHCGGPTLVGKIELAGNTFLYLGLAIIFGVVAYVLLR
jgi:hypothetical protein